MYRGMWLRQQIDSEIKMECWRAQFSTGFYATSWDGAE